ncbi:cupredoxin domain-containing protein [Haladaptatus sp. ZSTT2]|uniref:cupredoxin domain-containing protein n=1 Tax=Haladaptatus sp. ZSTT2 TaxID=3120515 RepID=UPI00300F42FD
MSRDTGENSRYSLPTRRTVLRTLGVGTAVAALGGVAAGETGDGTQTSARGGTQSTFQADNDCPPCIDDLMGYASLTTELDLPEALMPQHTVELRLDDADVLFPEEGDSDEQADGEAEGFPDFYFDPVGLAISVGDIIEFPNASADLHTVTAIHPRFFGLPRRIPEGAAPFSSPPVMSGENWIYQFTEPGVYDIMCLPHFDLGMVMRVVVTGDGCEQPKAPAGSEQLPPPVATVLDAELLTPQNIIDNGPIAWEDLKGEIPTFNPDELFAEGGEGGSETDGEANLDGEETGTETS